MTTVVKAVDEASVEKKFTSAKNTQESIQSLSLWALHHKTQHEQIVEIWLNVLKKSKMQRRITLFYLCNEIVQTCKRKHAVVYKDAFKEVLRDAALLVRDNCVRGNIERIFTIWGERGVYDTDFVEELIAILNNTKVRATLSNKLLAAFKPSKLRESLVTFTTLEKEVEAKRKRLTTMNLEAASQNILKHLKDRSHGRQYARQIEDSYKNLHDYVANVDKETKERMALLDMLEQSELFYDSQYGEAKIVTNAYKNFGTRVNNLRKRLEDLKKTLPDPLSPIPSPSVDAPSPTESVPDNTEDNTETVDMDMSNSDDDGTKMYSPSQMDYDDNPDSPGICTKLQSETTICESTTQNEAEVTLPAKTESSVDITNINYNASFLPTLYSGILNSPVQLSISNVVTAQQTTDPTKLDSSDEGSATPVQDEKEDKSEKPEPISRVANPIEFLNQLLSQSRKESQGNTDFLQSLSVLTKSMQTKFQKPTQEAAIDVSSNTSQPVAHSGSNLETNSWTGSKESASPIESDSTYQYKFKSFYNAQDYLPATVATNENITEPTKSIQSMEENKARSKVFDLLPPPMPPIYNFSSSDYTVAKIGSVSQTYGSSQYLPDNKSLLFIPGIPVVSVAQTPLIKSNSVTTVERTLVTDVLHPSQESVYPVTSNTDNEFLERLKKKTGCTSTGPPSPDLSSKSFFGLSLLQTVPASKEQSTLVTPTYDEERSALYDGYQVFTSTSVDNQVPVHNVTIQMVSSEQKPQFSKAPYIDNMTNSLPGIPYDSMGEYLDDSYAGFQGVDHSRSIEPEFCPSLNQSPPNLKKFNNGQPTTMGFNNRPPTSMLFKNAPHVPIGFDITPSQSQGFNNEPHSFVRFNNGPPSPMGFNNKPPVTMGFDGSLRPPSRANFQHRGNAFNMQSPPFPPMRPLRPQFPRGFFPRY